jgi:glucans biosynthesis protein
MLDASDPSCPVERRPCGVSRCRLHGGKGGRPKGERNGADRTGRYTAEAKAERRQVRAVIQELRRLMDSSE